MQQQAWLGILMIVTVAMRSARVELVLGVG